MEYQKKSHSVYLLTYHIVFVTKYRRPVITNEIGDFMKNHAAYLCGRFDGEMISAETDRDHIHMLVSLPPDIAPSRLVTVLKTQLSKEVRTEYSEEVRRQLWGIPSGLTVILLQQPEQRLWKKSGSTLTHNAAMTTNENMRKPADTLKRKSSDILSPHPAIHPQPTAKWKLSDQNLNTCRMGYSC